MTRFRLLDGLRALLAAAVLAALIAGVPLALYALAGSPLPPTCPTWANSPTRSPTATTAPSSSPWSRTSAGRHGPASW
ncbi:hypothetical protein [Microbispora sp. H10949]|uniref:hypothetical protein n=1 Tax=Microbispora sp. H10949 TaxID=2729111 RepID=UPI0016003F01|nr:hypothetical protein [Microbispora sp. H10949]